ncbi:MAG TPA: PIN domain-containing protein [Candidatus Limnocylindria bacterium]|nr:PIN domain-containing protein [Candidatus Limnocylindria bacterium]
MIFADSSFWVALYNRGDDEHLRALSLARDRSSTLFVTTNHVRGETWTFLARRAGHRAAVRFLDGLERSPRVRTLFVSEDMEGDAVRWLRRHDEREYSFVDATSFVAMRAMRLSEALTFDADFAAAGFRSLPAAGKKT